jgi:glycosyltransferase involved in cell wall biosynthesis
VKPVRAAIVYHYIAHYREPIFRLLCSGEDRPVEYHVYASVESDDPSLKVLEHDPSKTSPELVKRWTPVHNIWILKKLLWQPAILGLAVSRQVDCLILLGNANFLSTWVAAVLGRLTGKRVLMWSHGYLRRERRLKAMTRFVFYRLANALLLYGNRARTILGELGYPPREMYVVYNSLEYDRQMELRRSLDAAIRDETRRELGVADDEHLIVSVGRMNRAKRFSELVEGVARALEQGAKLRLVMVGDGPDRAELESLAERLKITDRTQFLGPIYDELRVARIIYAADLFVVPGDIGLSLIHAFMFGVPVISHANLNTQNPELEALRLGVNGDLFREHDIDDLARVIRRWLDRLAQPGVRAEVALRCQEVVDRFFQPRYQREVIDRAVQNLPPLTETPGGVTESPSA